MEEGQRDDAFSDREEDERLDEHSREFSGAEGSTSPLVNKMSWSRMVLGGNVS